MKSKNLYLVMLIALILAQISCSIFASPTNTPIEQEQIYPQVRSTEEKAESTIIPAENIIPIRFVPFNYTTEDLGDGWIQGEITLAIENPSNKPIVFEEIIIEHPILTTKEGPTYGAYVNYIDETHITVGWEGFRPDLYLPPNFRFAYVQTRNQEGQYYESFQVTFKFAKASTPDKLVFPNHPYLDFVIPPEGQVIEFPTSQNTDFLPFSSLAGTVIFKDSEGVEMTFSGRCGSASYFGIDTGGYIPDGIILLEVDVINHDQFYEKIEQIVQKISVFTYSGHYLTNTTPKDYFRSKGEFWFYGEELCQEDKGFCYQSFKIGPGISGKVYGLLDLSDFPNEQIPVVVFWDNNGYNAVSINDCGFANPDE
jgi:hypothetical protein